MFRVLRYLRPYGPWAAAAVFLIVIAGLTDLLTPWPLKLLVDHALGTYPPPAWLTALLGSSNRQTLLVFGVVAGLGVALLHNGLAVLNNYVQTRLDQRMVLDFRSDLFQHAQRLSLAFHDQRRSGMLIYAINSQADAAARLVMAVPPLAQSVLTLLGMLWIL